MSRRDREEISINMDRTDRTPFSIEQDALREWPFTFHRVERTLDPALIEARAKQQLFHALNDGHLVVFAGSGLSSAYGRLGWAAWQDRQIGVIQRLADAYLDCARCSLALLDCLEYFLRHLAVRDAALRKSENESEMQRILNLVVDASKKLPNDPILTLLDKHRTQFKYLGENSPDWYESLQEWGPGALNMISIKRREVHSRSEEIRQLNETFSALVTQETEAPLTFQCAAQILDLIHLSAPIFLAPMDKLREFELADAANPPTEARIGFGRQLDVPRKIVTDLCAIVPSFEVSNLTSTPSLEKALKTIQECADSSKWSDLVDSDAPPADQVLKMWKTLLEAACKYQVALQRFWISVRSRDARLGLHEMAKVLLVDECAHAEDIVRNLVDYDPDRGRVAWQERAIDKDVRNVNRQLRLSLGATDKTNLRRDVQGLRENRDRYQALGFFTTEGFRNVLTHLQEKSHGGSRWSEVLDIIKRQLAENVEPSRGRRWTVERTFISPTHRYVLEVLMTLVPDPYKEFGGWQKHDDKVPSGHQNLPRIRRGLELDEFKSRLSLIDEKLDPIAKLVGDLGIRRFMTVNYDFEIERYFQDIGFNRPSLTSDTPDRLHVASESLLPNNAYRTDGKGAILHDYEFAREHSPELVAFSIDHDRDEAGVFHLHGRADKKSRLVVTETDYTDLYLRNDQYRDSVDESIQIAFSANPLLFVGVGMSESDILRPLRQFISDKGEASGRTAFVLFPGDKSRTERYDLAASLYLRYGVHAIHYGIGAIEFEDPSTRRSDEDEVLLGETAQTPSNVHEIDWLHRALQLTGELKKINRERHAALLGCLVTDTFSVGSQQRKLNERWDRYIQVYKVLSSLNPKDSDGVLRDIVNTVGRLEPRPNYNDGQLAIELMLGVPIEDSDGGVSVASLEDAFKPKSPASANCTGTIRFAQCLFPSSDNNFDIKSDQYLQFEYELLAQMLLQTVRTSYTNLPDWRPVQHESGNDMGNTNLPDLSEQDLFELRAVVADMKARLVALEGIENSLRTATLCIALEGLDQARRAWWNWWLLSPPHRSARFDRDPVSTVDSCAEPIPLRFVRHWPDPVNSRLGSDIEADLKGIPQKTGIRAYDEFVNSVEMRLKQDIKEERAGAGRRQYCVLAPTGHGKGAFFSAFASMRGMRRFVQVMSRRYTPCNDQNGRKKTIRRPRYCACIYFNLSYSTEIASTFDMLADALHHAIIRAWDPKSHPDPPETIADKWVQSAILQLDEGRKSLPRVAHLRLAFDTFSRISARVLEDPSRGAPRQPRFLICVNAIEILHYDGGIPKNREIEEILTLISGESTRQYPFDLVLMSNENRVSELFRHDTRFIRRYGQMRTPPVPPAEPSSFDVILKSKVNGHVGRTITCGLAGTGTPFITILRPTDKIEPTSRLLGILENIRRRQLDSGIATVPLESEIDADGRTRIISCSLANIHIYGDEDSHVSQNAAPSDDGALSTDDVAYAYFIRVLQPNHMLTGTFMPLAFVLFVKFIREQFLEERNSQIDDESSQLPRICQTAEEHESKFPAVMRLFERIESSIERQWSHDDPGKSVGVSRVDPGSNEPRLGVFADAKARRDRMVVRWLSHLVRALNKLNQCEKANGRPPVLEKYLTNSSKLLQKPLGSASERDSFEHVAAFLEERYETESGKAAQRDWNQIRRLLRGNRYCMTIILAAAQRIALSGRTVIRGAELAEDFIRRTGAQTKSVTREGREIAVLNQVLDVYQQFHQKGNPRFDMDFHRLIIRHLGVIGVPVSADVLVRAPAIRAYFGEIVEDSEVRRYSRLVKAMSELVERGLIFRVKPNYKLRESTQRDRADIANKNTPPTLGKRFQFVHGRLPGDKEHRYALHRLLQRLVVQTMGGGPHEFIQINGFAPSLYASMPADLPRLNHEAYGFLRSLVAALSQYPDQELGRASAESWHLSGAPLNTQVQALRAAMSTVRSVFSIAVVSRFEEYASTGKAGEETPRGYFEEYRVQVRWIIRKAAYLLYPKIDPNDYQPDSEHDHLVALYRDEIVWLYNECGVINLVQGNVIEAINLFNQALRLNRRIEGSAGGAHHNRIALNFALALIERGRLSEARPLLAEVSSSEKKHSRRPGRIWHIARGYLGLIEQIGGDPKLAGEQLDQAIEGLRVYGDSRSCAVFLRHRGDLYRYHGKTKSASKCIDESINFAQRGGHEDLHQISRLARIRLDLRTVQTDPDRLDVMHYMRRIEVIQRYAEVMEMPALLCETYSVRAEFLIDQGDLSRSGYLFAKAMILAKRNGMALRLNSATTGYARVLHRRGLSSQARQLLTASLEMAKRNHSQIQIRQVESTMEEIDNEALTTG